MAILNENIDEFYMKCALELARRGTECSPNPRVGCVIVRGGEVIGRGWHKVCGGPHAEVEAMRDAGGDIAGADVYVTLEPCSHYGKTPPCADMLVEHGVKRVVAGMEDPNPLVAGHGLEKLRASGIETLCGVLEEECKWANRGFLRRMVQKRPWVTLKVAASLDGKVALANGASKWITGESARRCVHGMRAKSDAVITGVGTVIADDPQLTVRDVSGETPLRAVLDRSLRTPVDSNLVRGGAVIFTNRSEPEKIKLLEDAGARVEVVGGDDFLGGVLTRLCEMNVNYLMVEAGPQVTSAFIASGLADELALFAAPKPMGRGMSFTDGLEFSSMESVPALRGVKYTSCGEDLLIRGVFECSPDL